MFVCGDRIRGVVSWLILLGVAVVGSARGVLAGEEGGAFPSWTQQDYTLGYWFNGWRKAQGDASKDVLCLESGRYGFRLNVGDFSDASLGPWQESLTYEEAIVPGARGAEMLAPARLNIELASKGRVFRATSCIVGDAKEVKRLKGIRLWESGRWVQHFDLLDLQFEDDGGNVLHCEGALNIVAWPDSLSFKAEVSPSFGYEEGVHAGVTGKAWCVREGPWRMGETEDWDSAEFTMELWVKVPQGLVQDSRGWLLCAHRHEHWDGNFGFSMDGGEVVARLNIGGGKDHAYQLEQKRNAFKKGAWNHLALSYNGKVMRFFVNGMLQREQVINKPRMVGKNSLLLGQREDEAGSVFSAVFDGVAFWDRALSSEELRERVQGKGRLHRQDGLRIWEDFESQEGRIPLVPQWEDVAMRVQLVTEAKTWEERKLFAGKWTVGDRRSLVLHCDVAEGRHYDRENISVRFAAGKSWKAAYSDDFNAYVAQVDHLSRKWETGYTDIRDYDEFTIEVNNKGQEGALVPLLLDLRDVANITGVCPILCDEEGVPTGIPVQLSKNWHEKSMGSYLRAYMLLPAAQGSSRYRLRLAYGFYGTLPSASHAQLSLVGYGGNGRWEQLAIGCWGETYCMDLDMSCVDVAVTDIRMLMSRKGTKGRMWHWTEAGWGGDWLCAKKDGQKHYFSEMKTAYQAHGPCLTDVQYAGYYGSEREVAVDAVVRTLRTDDYARTFTQLRYRFDQEVDLQDGWLFKQGRSRSLATPVIAYGNKEGLLGELLVPDTAKANEWVVDRLTLSGEGPWWVAFPGAGSIEPNGKPTGSRALVIRDYRASWGGKQSAQPTISMPVLRENRDGSRNVDLLLVPPAEVSEVQSGDAVTMDLEWITVHRDAEDYYGPNEAYRQHLQEHPRSWRTVYREALGNDLEVQVLGGQLLHSYPIIVAAEQPEVTVHIQGGVGMVPIRFEGLPRGKGYVLMQVTQEGELPLDQSVHGNDFWQTDYDEVTQTFSLSYNLPLDGLAESVWVLRGK